RREFPQRPADRLRPLSGAGPAAVAAHALVGREADEDDPGRVRRRVGAEEIADAGIVRVVRRGRDRDGPQVAHRATLRPAVATATGTPSAKHRRASSGGLCVQSDASGKSTATTPASAIAFSPSLLANSRWSAEIAATSAARAAPPPSAS